MSMATICAMLEDAGYRRYEMGKVSLRYIRNVLQHRRNRDGSLSIAPVGDATNEQPSDPFDELRTVLRMRGWPTYRIEQRVRQTKEAERQAVLDEKREREEALAEIRQRAEQARNATVRR